MTLDNVHSYFDALTVLLQSLDNNKIDCRNGCVCIDYIKMYIWGKA